MFHLESFGSSEKSRRHAIVADAAHGTSWELEEVQGNAVNTMLTLAAISTVASLQVFGRKRPIFQVYGMIL